jgi:hypothetical protein
MTKPIQQLCEERGESDFQLVDALGATPQDIHVLEQGIASLSVERSRVLTENNTPMPARATSSTSAALDCLVPRIGIRGEIKRRDQRAETPATRQQREDNDEEADLSPRRNRHRHDWIDVDHAGREDTIQHSRESGRDDRRENHLAGNGRAGKEQG